MFYLKPDKVLKMFQFRESEIPSVFDAHPAVSWTKGCQNVPLEIAPLFEIL